MVNSFNYISFRDWQAVEGEVNKVVMWRGRMFEYTPYDIEKRLQCLDNTAISFLKGLPTFLCTEVLKEDEIISMLVKYVRILDIHPFRNEVRVVFETIIDFSEVNFDKIESAQAIFGVDLFQFYRTHWAVREGNDRYILDQLAKNKPELKEAVGRIDFECYDTSQVSPPPREKKTIGEADSVGRFLDLLYDIPKRDGAEIFFRGHSDARYELTPSLLRKRKNGDWQFMPSEDRLCKELMIAHYDEFQSDEYCFDRLVRMQHYGLPTRLLDVSGNPLVALFFACSCKMDQIDTSGEVIIFQITRDNVKYYDSDTVSCLSNLSNLTYMQKNQLDLNLDEIDFRSTDVCKRLLHYIMSEKDYFENRIIPDDLRSIICVKAKRTNTRIKSQSGAFLLFGHEAALPDNGQDGIEISRVKITNKLHILEQLDRININATTVYPSIDQTAVHLRDQQQSITAYY